jgi:hypothetical protein
MQNSSINKIAALLNKPKGAVLKTLEQKDKDKAVCALLKLKFNLPVKS